MRPSACFTIPRDRLSRFTIDPVLVIRAQNRGVDS